MQKISENRKISYAAVGINIPYLKSYYKCIMIQTAKYWHKNSPIEQWSQIEDLDINLHTHEHLISYKDVKIHALKIWRIG